MRIQGASEWGLSRLDKSTSHTLRRADLPRADYRSNSSVQMFSHSNLGSSPIELCEGGLLLTHNSVFELFMCLCSLGSRWKLGAILTRVMMTSSWIFVKTHQVPHLEISVFGDGRDGSGVRGLTVLAGVWEPTNGGLLITYNSREHWCLWSLQAPVLTCTHPYSGTYM